MLQDLYQLVACVESKCLEQSRRSLFQLMDQAGLQHQTHHGYVEQTPRVTHAFGQQEHSEKIHSQLWQHHELPDFG